MELQKEVTKGMPNDLTAFISKEAESNELFRTVCYSFAKRERDRRNLTLKALKFTIDKQGVKYSIKSYEDVFKFLAALDLGVLEVNKKGKIVALQKIIMPLNVIGKMAGNKALEEVPKPSLIKEKPNEKDFYKVALTVTMKEGKIDLTGDEWKIEAGSLGKFFLQYKKLMETFNKK